MRLFVHHRLVPLLFLVIAYSGCFLGCTPGPVSPGPDADASAQGDDSGAPAPLADAAPLAPEAGPSEGGVPPGTPPGVVAGCANLRVHGCSEGASPTCELVNTKILADGLTLLGPPKEPPMACVASAKNVAAIRMCALTWKRACAGQ